MKRPLGPEPLPPLNRRRPPSYGALMAPDPERGDLLRARHGVPVPASRLAHALAPPMLLLLGSTQTCTSTSTTRYDDEAGLSVAASSSLRFCSPKWQFAGEQTS